MAKPYQYKGILAKPIGGFHWAAARHPRTGEYDHELAALLLKPQVEARIKALCDDLSIPHDDPDMWRRLAIGLAKRHVKGFSTKDPKRPGAKLKPHKHARLVQLVDEKMSAGETNLSHAIRTIARQLKLAAKDPQRAYRRFKEKEEQEKAKREGPQWVHLRPRVRQN